MKDDYVTIKEGDNGFVIEANNYAKTPHVRSLHVARDADELYAVIRKLFPPMIDDCRQGEFVGNEKAG